MFLVKFIQTKEAQRLDKKIGMRLLKTPTTGMPSAWILKQITFPPPQSYFLPRLDHFGNTLGPLITKEQQDEIRMTCLMVGIDAEACVGLPKKEEFVTDNIHIPESYTPSEQRILSRYERQTKIEENMMNMDEKVAKYRAERRELKNKNKSDLPF